jgi:2',3'-cyclic-nucleotide 2'-phosphodiesterase (5'-nucleotidase family)
MVILFVKLLPAGVMAKHLRRLATASVLVALALSVRFPDTISAQRAAQFTLSIVGTNDLHGGIVPRDGRGGLALLGGYVKNLRAARARDGGAVLLVDGGDMFQGTLESNLTEGASVVAAYNALGYAAATVGNHEFDFGPVGERPTPVMPTDDPRGALKARAAEARFPFLAANLIDDATGRPVAWRNVKPAVTVDAAGMKVGIVGVMTSEALSATISANVRGLKVAPLAPAIAAEASRLRAGGASVVIVAAHAGGRCTNFAQPTDVSSCDPASEIIAVVRELPRGLIDVVVAGHTHAGVAHQVSDTAIIESFSTGRSFGRVDLTIDRASREVTDRRIFQPRDLCAFEDPAAGRCDSAPIPGPGIVQSEYEGVPVKPDPDIVKVLAPTLQKMSALKARSLGVHLATPVRRQGSAGSPLGNLFTDALRESFAGADVALHNTSGGLRADLPAGPLVYGSVYEVMPFDNKVVPLHLTGAQLRLVFTRQLRETRRLFGVSGIQVRAQCSAGALDVAMIRPSGAAVKDDESLVVVASDFLAMGGDDILTPVTPSNGFPIPDNAPLARDVLAEHLRRHGAQLREEQLVDAQNPRVVYPGSLPVKCDAQ